MFRKVLKYDMRYMARFWWIIAVSIIGLSVVASFLLRFIITNIGTDTFLSAIAGLAIFPLVFAIIAIVGSLIVTEVFAVIRFYKNFFTDEGYLTFTLPVSRSKLLISKVLSAFIWMAAHFLLIIGCIFIFCTFAPPTDGGGFINPVVYKALGSFLRAAWETVGVWLIVYILEAILIFGLLALYGLCLIYLCVTIGAIVAKKQKVLAAIGIYYLVNAGISAVTSIFGSIFLVGFIEGMIVMMQTMSRNSALAAIAVMLLLVCVIIASVICIIYNMMRYRIERRLNLA